MPYIYASSWPNYWNCDFSYFQPYIKVWVSFDKHQVYMTLFSPLYASCQLYKFVATKFPSIQNCQIYFNLYFACISYLEIILCHISNHILHDPLFSKIRKVLALWRYIFLLENNSNWWLECIKVILTSYPIHQRYSHPNSSLMMRYNITKVSVILFQSYIIITFWIFYLSTWSSYLQCSSTYK